MCVIVCDGDFNSCGGCSCVNSVVGYGGGSRGDGGGDGDDGGGLSLWVVVLGCIGGNGDSCNVGFW